MPRLRDVEALDTEWRGVVDVVDGLLERADVCLDEFSGAVRRLKPAGLGREGQRRPQQQQQVTHSAYREEQMSSVCFCSNPELMEKYVTKNANA